MTFVKSPIVKLKRVQKNLEKSKGKDENMNLKKG